MASSIPGVPEPVTNQNTPDTQSQTPQTPTQSNWIDGFKADAEQFWGNSPATDYPNKPVGIDDQINSMPNAEKLSGAERWLYNILPGVAESSIGKALASFGESPAGKALSKLDILAEGFERGLGLLAQYRDAQPGDDFKLKDAWAAGSLFYDTVNLPSFKYDKSGNVIGIEAVNDMPGAVAVTEARKLLEQGKSLEEVRGLLYSNLGALALRSQLQDTMGHVVLDPLNWALAAVKPVERLHAIRNLAISGKLDVEYVKGLESAARTAGNIEDATKYAEAIAKAEQNGKAMTRFDRFAIAITGGIPSAEDFTKMSKGKLLLNKLNPFALTPSARASELLDIVTSNVGEYLVRPNFNKDPEEFIKMFSNVAKGGVGDTWGHLAMTKQGRTVQGFITGAEATVKGLGKEWKVFEGERNLFNRIIQVMPEFNEKNLYKLLKENPQLVFEKYAKFVSESGDKFLMEELQSGKINKGLFESIGKMDSNTMLTKQGFYVRAMAEVEDVAAKQAIIQFGIKEKGIITKWTDALKAWEGAAFLKINPANAARNVINNDITLVGRGLWGTMSEKSLNAFWEGKFMPPQMTRAFNMGTEFEADLATTRIMDVLEGKQTGVLSKVKGAAAKFETPISKFSTEMEAKASLRASTNGWLEFHNKYWNPKTGFTSITKTLDTATIDAMENAVPGITKILDNVAQDAGADGEKFVKLLQKELEHSPAAVFDEASKNLGYKIDDVLGAEVTHVLQDGLPDAIKNGSVREFVDGVKLQMEKHVDDMFNQHVQELPGIIKAQVQAGGQLQYHRIFGKATDEFWGGNIEHAIRMSTINEVMDAAEASGDFAKVNSLWEKILTDSENHFGRVWKKFDAYQEGLRQGAEAAGIKYPAEVQSSFNDMQKGWKEVFDFRNSEYRKLFDAKLSGKEYTKTLSQLKEEINAMYTKMASREDELFQHVDDLMADSLDEFSAGMYRNYRDQASALRLSDRQKTIDFYKALDKATKDEAPALWAKYWQDRTAGLEQMRQLDMRGSSAIQGNSEAISLFNKAEAPRSNDIYGLAQQYGIPSATSNGARNDRRILNTVNKYLDEGTPKYKKVSDIPMEVAQKAFDARNSDKSAKLASSVEKAFMPDADKIFKDPMPIETAMSELNYGRSYAALESVVESASSKPLKSKLLSDLPEELQSKIEGWTNQVQDEMSAFRSSAVQYSQFRRDSALLDYNRRTNFDNWVGHMAPFAFWTTHSVANWAIHSIDRPAMLTSYFRVKKLFETAGLTDQNVPTRLKGSIRVNLPFTPDWMGDQFVDPLRTLLPFDAWLQPWEQAQQNKFSIEGKTQNTLEQMLQAGSITQADYDSAITNKSGAAWEQAYAAAKEGGDNYDAMDFVNMTMTPHAPLMWAYNAANGTKQDIGAFTPMSRSVKNFATMMGVDDWSNSPYNVEGRIRKSMGLPAYDKWDDYRVGREISNLAADGNYSMDKIKEAMQVAALVEAGKIKSADAVKNNPIYAEATKRANQEYASGWSGSILSLFGINIKSFPTGEQRQRQLADEFSAAIMERENGNPEALAKFFDKHPEYEARLALFKKPEERLKTFMIDNVWTRWNELPKLTQDEIKDQLGPDFANKFANKETRNYDAINPLQLQVWLKLMGGREVGKLSTTEEVMVELNQLKTTDPETAWRVQTFYDARDGFQNWYKLQNEYFNLDQSKRSEFIANNPELKQYWDFRRSWMTKNPDLVRFLTDDPKQLKQYENVQRQPEVAVPTAEEIKKNISQPTAELLAQWQQGQSLPDSVKIYVSELAKAYNMDERTLLGILTGR